MEVKICKDFNLCVKDLLKEINKISNIDKLKYITFKVNSLFRVNICSNMLMTAFITNILPLNNYIKEENSKLFTELINKQEDSELLVIMKELYKMWNILTDVNKKKIFEYFLVLNFYAEEYTKNYIKNMRQ